MHGPPAVLRVVRAIDCRRLSVSGIVPEVLAPSAGREVSHQEFHGLATPNAEHIGSALDSAPAQEAASTSLQAAWRGKKDHQESHGLAMTNIGPVNTVRNSASSQDVDATGLESAWRGKQDQKSHGLATTNVGPVNTVRDSAPSQEVDATGLDSAWRWKQDHQESHGLATTNVGPVNTVRESAPSQEVDATGLESAWRGNQDHQEFHGLATTDSDLVDDSAPSQEAAATRLQAAWRGKQGRDLFAHEKRVGGAAKRISNIAGMNDLLADLQLDFDGDDIEYDAPLEEPLTEEELAHAAATHIQAAWRGKLVRSQLKHTETLQESASSTPPASAAAIPAKEEVAAQETTPSPYEPRTESVADAPSHLLVGTSDKPSGDSVASSIGVIAEHGKQTADQEYPRESNAGRTWTSARLKPAPLESSDAGFKYTAEDGFYTVIAKEGDTLLGFAPSAFPPSDVMVATVDRGSWAEKVNIQVDDVIEAINGRPISSFTKQTFKETMRQRPLGLVLLRGEFVEYEDEAAEGEDDEDEAHHEGAEAKKCMTHVAHGRINEQGTDGDNPGRSLPEIFVDARALKLQVDDTVDMLGFIPAAFPPEPMTIDSIVAGSWAELHGLIAGDTLVAIGSELVDTIPYKELKRAMRVRPLVLTFQQKPRLDTHARSSRHKGLGSQAPDTAHDSTLSDSLPRKSRRPSNPSPSQVHESTIAGTGDGNDWEDDGDDSWNPATSGKPSRDKADKKDKKTKLDKKDKPCSSKAIGGSDDKKKTNERKEKSPARADHSKHADKAEQLAAFAYPGDAKLGITIDYPPDATIVKKVKPGSWAEINNITVGLRLVKLNGKDVAKMTKDKIKSLIDEKRPLEMTLVRDKEKKNKPAVQPADQGVFAGLLG
eukprot:TRINITY_DN10131_c0_g1_i1.p1 TRINITY_DN10131_c0_g1~~TRINITY_DN10131_c0_g1_i1.p1  ORF type:complete len:884 (-),score=162.31 TRINITY_DN10131_c0_g1_i1:526-3177(-)